MVGPGTAPARHAEVRRVLAILAWVATVLAALWLLSMTLQPKGAGTTRINLLPFSRRGPILQCLLGACAWSGVRRSLLAPDLVGNLAVFVPFGAMLCSALLLSGRARWSRPAWLWATMGGAALSFSIELAQLGVPGRVTDVDDLILNTLGSLCGALPIHLLAALARRADRKIQPDKRQMR